MNIRELDTKEIKYINLIATLHVKAFPSFFLTKLGCPFLCTLYKGYLEDHEAGIIVAEEQGGLMGFLAYANNYSEFFKGLIKHHLLRFAFCSTIAAIKNPRFIKKLFGAFKKSDSVKREEKYVELASICVDPDVEGKGIGTELIDYLKNKVDFNSYAYISLETDADDNDKANAFYRKNGFKLKRTYTTGEGRRMNEYRYVDKLNVIQ